MLPLTRRDRITFSIVPHDILTSAVPIVASTAMGTSAIVKTRIAVTLFIGININTLAFIITIETVTEPKCMEHFMIHQTCKSPPTPGTMISGIIMSIHHDDFITIMHPAGISPALKIFLFIYIVKYNVHYFLVIHSLDIAIRFPKPNATKTVPAFIWLRIKLIAYMAVSYITSRTARRKFQVSQYPICMIDEQLGPKNSIVIQGIILASRVEVSCFRIYKMNIHENGNIRQLSCV